MSLAHAAIRELAARNLERRAARGGIADAAVVAWLDDPAMWAAENIPTLNLTDYQSEALRGLTRGGRVAVRGPRSLGKTTLLAVAILWFADTSELARIDWKIATTAGSWGQLEHFLWPEVGKWARRMSRPLMGTLQVLGIKGEHGRAYATSPARPELAEGAHAERVLLVFDEAKAIAAPVFDALEGVDMTGTETMQLVASTPGAPVGRFYAICAAVTGFERWVRVAVTAQQAIDAGRMTAERQAELARQWGDESPQYLQHVLGQFAADDDGAIMPWSWVDQARQRWDDWARAGAPVPTGVEVVVGLDVAAHGKNETVAFKRSGHVVHTVGFSEAYTPDVVDLADRVHRRFPEADRFVVDASGMGLGTAHRMRKLNPRSVAFLGGEPARGWRDATGLREAVNLRAAAWWSLAEQLSPAWDGGPTLALPRDDALIGELTAVRPASDARGRVKLEPKEATSKRIGRSPDRADAVVLACWSPPATPSDYLLPGGDGPGPLSRAA